MLVKVIHDAGTHITPQKAERYTHRNTVNI